MARPRPGSTRVARRLAATSVGLVLMAGCGSGGAGSGVGCTQVGGLEGVMFEYGAVLVGHRNETLLVHACVEETCEDLTLGRDNHQHGVTIGAELLRDGSPVEVSLQITTPSGDTLFEGHTPARPEFFQPNGPDCEPHTWSAQVFASGKDRLRQKFLSTNAA